MNDGTRWLASSSHQSDNKLELIIRTNYIDVLEKFTLIHEFKLVTIESGSTIANRMYDIIVFLYSNLINLNNIPLLNSDLR